MALFAPYASAEGTNVKSTDDVTRLKVTFDHAERLLSWCYCGAPMAQKLAPMRQAGVFYVEYINLCQKSHVKLDLKALGAKRHMGWIPLYIYHVRGESIENIDLG